MAQPVIFVDIWALEYEFAHQCLTRIGVIDPYFCSVELRLVMHLASVNGAYFCNYSLLILSRQKKLCIMSDSAFSTFHSKR